MSKEILFKAATQAISREDVAEFFIENVAYHLKRGEAIPLGAGRDALLAGNKFVDPKPAPRLTFEITVAREEPTDEPGKMSLGFNLVWEESDRSEAHGDGQGESSDNYAGVDIGIFIVASIQTILAWIRTVRSLQRKEVTFWSAI